MANSPPPLLARFFAQGGDVLYKGYPPHRGDDVEALLELATVLPANVQFKPFLPQRRYLLDIRELLPEVLRSWQSELELPLKEGGERTVLPAAPAKLPDDFRPFLNQVVEALVPASSGIDAEGLYANLVTRRPDVVQVLLRFVLPQQRSGAKAPEGDTRPVESAVQEDFQLSDEAPTLIVGRPEDFRGYHARPVESEWTDFRQLLDRAGYPNRFYFATTEPRPTLCDRKTRRIHRQIHYGTDDVGFLFLSRLDTGRPVMVAAGVSSLGTYAAVRLLQQHRPDLERLAEVFYHETHATSVDIGFRCRLERLANDRPFPLGLAPRHLRIELLNPDDPLGYTWSRSAYRQLSFLFAPSPAPPLPRGRYLTWSFGGSKELAEASEHRRLSRFRLNVVQAEAVGKNQFLLPSGPMEDVVRRILEDIEADRRGWRNKLEDWGDSPLERIEQDRSYRTFRPTLLLGATGVGKEWIAQLIASRWAGKTLETDLARIRVDRERSLPRQALGRKKEDRPVSASDDILETCQRALAAQLQHWREAAPHAATAADISSSWLTFSPVSYPETLLDAELFGIADEVATGVKGRPGAFIVAGTGVLFLDELLELPLEQQSRLLVALQTGRVRPAGAGREYAYVSHLVAATNRASSEAELLRLVEEKVVRRDLVARFSHRYAIPAVRQRPLEIIPILLMLLRAERLTRARRNGATYFRISRPALEVLATYSYPENVRDLRRLADSLPDELVQSFAQRSDDLKTIADHAVCLRHLRLLGTAAVADEGADLSEGSLPHETDFFEFELTFPAQAAAVLDDPAVGSRYPLGLERIAGALREMKACVDRTWPDLEDLDGARLKDLINQDDFRPHFAQLHAVLLEEHNRRDRLRPGDINAAMQECPAAVEHLLPFARYAQAFGRVPRRRGNIDPARLRQWNAAIQELVRTLEEQLSADSTAHEQRNRRRPRGLHSGVMLSVLLGHAVYG